MKNKDLFGIKLLSIMLIISNSMMAQNTSLPYFNSFENIHDTIGWVFKKTTGASGFEIGNATHCLGNNSMYISPDNGVTASYGTTATGYVSVAYKQFTLSAGTYTLTYDYQIGGDGTNQDMMVALVPSATTINASAEGDTYPSEISNNWVGGARRNPLWTHVSQTITIPIGGGSYNLCLAFRCNSTNVSAPGVCIDNIQLDTVKSRMFDCTYVPYNIQTQRNDLGDLIISWYGNASQYEVIAASASDPQDNSFCRHTGITTRSDTMHFSELNNDGLYFIYIRAICGNDTSIFEEISGVQIYNASYSALTFPGFDPGRTICTYGTYSNPYQNIGIIDYGSSNKYSRHTLHTDTSELDSHTGNALLTVPSGELKSVRLGNWNDSAQGESITYTFTVPANGNNILILKYAIVADFSSHQDPAEFKVKLMDLNNLPLGPYYVYESPDYSYSYTCLCVDGWNHSPNWIDSIGETYYLTKSETFWKDWTTLGINLSQYAGQTIKICLTTNDCDWDFHFGYAYFTLSFSNYTEIITSSCSSTGALEAKAPDGFNYSWKNDCTGQVVSNAQTYTIDETDYCTYSCTCSYKNNQYMYFIISACNKPKQPESSLSYNLGYSNCQTNISFANTTQAYIMKNGVKTYLPNQAITAQNWSVQTQHHDRSYYNMTSNDTTLGQIVIPQEGDTIQVTLTSWVNDCDDDTTITIYVPAFKTDSVVNLSLYQGGYVIVVDTVIYNPGTYTIVRPTRQGCSMTYHITVTQVTQYTVTANSNDATMGYVSGGGQYNDGQTASLSANAYSGYEFVGWSNGETNPYMSFIVESDTVFTAYFQATGTSVEVIEEDNDVILAPNPVRIGEPIVIEGDFNDEEMNGMIVEIVSAEGVVVKKCEIISLPIQIEGVSVSGNYIVRILTNTGKMYVMKLIVQ